jgi:hypothetical protein
MADFERLASLLRFHPHPGPQPDPASLLRFFVDFEEPALKQAAVSAYLQLSLETYQSQMKFVQSLQKTLEQRKG